MKKILKILLVAILVILAVLVVTPVVFKKQLLEKARELANTSVNARIDFSDLKLNFFSDFPRLTVSLYDVSVTGTDTFEGDTLVAFEAFSATLNVMSLIGKKAIDVRQILLDRPRISAQVTEDGTASWDIAKESGEAGKETADTAGGGNMDLKVALKKFEIRSASVSYSDLSSGMVASMEDFNFILSGDLAADHSSLALSSTAGKLNFVMDGIRYVRDARLDISIMADADLVNHVFTLKDNSFSVNDLVLLLDGSVSLPEDEDVAVDVHFATAETSFKSLLSMVPAIYMRDFEEVETDGLLSLSGNIRGSLTDEHTPSADLKLLVENAMFNYPDLPESADRIHIDLDVQYDGIQNDNSVVDVNAFHVELGQNPVDFSMHMITPVSDPQVNARLETKIDFSTLAEVIPLEDVNLTGFLDAGIDIMGRMSSLKNERFDEFRADGRLELRDFELNSPDMPGPVMINHTLMNFSPQFVELADFDAGIGRSDVRMKGRLENFLPYVFEDGTVRGTLDLNGNLLDLNEFMSTGEVEEETTGDTVALSVFEVPANVDFIFRSDIRKVLFDSLDIYNLKGLITVRDRRVILRNLNMDALEGGISLSGEYNTQDITSPMVELSLDVNKIDIPSAFNAFVTVQQLAPVAERTTGTVSARLEFTSFLDPEMMPVMNSIVGQGSLGSEMIRIDNSATFEKIGDVLKSDRFRVITMENLVINFSIRNGRVYVQPYRTRIGSSELIFSGDQGIDQSMNYEVQMKIPRTELGSTAQAGIDELSSMAAAQGITLGPGETIDVKFIVTGTFSDPQVRPVFEEGVRNVAREVREQVQEKVEEKVEEVREDVQEEISREAERIMAEAQEQADRLKQEAKDAGEELVRVAEEEGQKRIDEAGSNPIRKLAAEQYARTLKSEAEEKAKRLEEEAEQKADEILKKAQEQADRLE